METHTATNKMNFTTKKETGVIIFNPAGIIIPANLVKHIVYGKISTNLARKILVREGDDYLLKFDQDYELRTSYCFTSRKYTIKFVDCSGIFDFRIMKFQNLRHAKYQTMLQMLGEVNDAINPNIKEIEDLAHKQNHTMILYGYIFWAFLSVVAFLAGLSMYDYLYGSDRVIIKIYTIITIGSFVYNVLMLMLVGFLSNPSNIEKMKKLLILQFIEGICIVLFILTVFRFALTR